MQPINTKQQHNHLATFRVVVYPQNRVTTKSARRPDIESRGVTPRKEIPTSLGTLRRRRTQIDTPDGVSETRIPRLEDVPLGTSFEVDIPFYVKEGSGAACDSRGKWAAAEGRLRRRLEARGFSVGAYTIKQLFLRKV